MGPHMAWSPECQGKMQVKSGFLRKTEWVVPFLLHWVRWQPVSPGFVLPTATCYGTAMCNWKAGYNCVMSSSRSFFWSVSSLRAPRRPEFRGRCLPEIVPDDCGPTQACWSTRGTTDLIVGIAGCLLSCRVTGTNCGRGSAWNNAGIEFVCCDFLLIVGSAVLLFGCPHGRCKSNYIWSTWCGIDSRETSSFMQLIPPNRSFFANYVVANRDVVSDWFSLALLRPKGLTGMQHPSQSQGTACGAKWDVASYTFFQPITNDMYTCQWSSAQCLFEYCCNCFAGPRFKVRPWSRNDQGFLAYDVDEF
jgi:hypothetical protein